MALSTQQINHIFIFIRYIILLQQIIIEQNASVTEGRFIELDVWCKKDQIRQIFGKLRDRLFLHRAVADVIHGCKREKAFPVK